MIFVTGSTGFVGKSICSYLRALGMPVCGLDRSLNPTTKVKLNSDNNIVIHCAWSGVFGSARNEEEVQTVNIKITSAVADFAIRCRAKQVIAFGSQAEYGNCDQITTEDTPLNPITLYGRMKVQCHFLLEQTLSVNRIPLTWLRLYDPYGPGDNPEWFLPYIIRSLLMDHSPRLTECTQVWDYIYIDDIASLVACLIRTPVGSNCVFNLSSGSPVLLRNVVDLVFSYIKPKTALPQYGAVQFRQDQQFYVVGCSERLTRATHWVPSTSLEVGIQNTINFFKRYS